MTQNKGHKKIVIIIAAVVLVVIAVAVGLIAYNNSPSVRLRKQLDLGNKYLAELNYEQAIAEFNKALEIVPDDAEALESLINAYLDWADELEAADDLDKALEILQKGFDATGDSRLSDRVERLKEKIAIRDEERIKAEMREELGITEQVQALLDNLYELSTAGNYEDAAVMVLAETKTFADVKAKFESSQYVQENNNSYILNEGNVRLGLYLKDDGYAENLYAYVGEYNGDKRQGEGAWYRLVVNYGFYPEYCIGHWENDIPSGEFEYGFFINYPANYSTLTGTVNNGRWEGDVILREIISPSTTPAVDMTGIFHNGIVTPQKNSEGKQYLFAWYGRLEIAPGSFRTSCLSMDYKENEADAIFGIPGYGEYTAEFDHLYNPTN